MGSGKVKTFLRCDGVPAHHMVFHLAFFCSSPSINRPTLSGAAMSTA
jgi:hypothetical protein